MRWDAWALVHAEHFLIEENKERKRILYAEDSCLPHGRKKVCRCCYLLTARVDVVVCFSLLYNGWQFTTTAVLVLNVSFIHPFFLEQLGLLRMHLLHTAAPHWLCFFSSLGSSTAGNVIYNLKLQGHSLPRRNTYVFSRCFFCSFGTFLFLLLLLPWAYWITTFQNVPCWSLEAQ